MAWAAMAGLAATAGQYLYKNHLKAEVDNSSVGKQAPRAVMNKGNPLASSPTPQQPGMQPVSVPMQTQGPTGGDADPLERARAKIAKRQQEEASQRAMMGQSYGGLQQRQSVPGLLAGPSSPAAGPLLRR